MKTRVIFPTDSGLSQKTQTELDDLTPKSIPPSNRQPKLLIVDDSPTFVETLEFHLQKAGYQVVALTQVSGTILTIFREKPDLILLDIEMPLLDGPELCGLIKRSKSSANIASIPVLFYSSLSESELSEKVIQHKAQGYIHKTLPIKQVIEKISAYLR
ncbi:MAG: response regulator [Acidobacteria bacterium]|nr:response regulator [Acidobacteriota bacterium]